MVKIVGLGFVGVDEMIKKVSSEIEYLNNGFEWDDIKEYILKNGSGVYEFSFGCRGGLEDFSKNDEYMSLDDLVKSSGESMEELMECYGVESEEEVLNNFREFYSDDEEFVLKDSGFSKCIGYYEESWSLFVNVKV